MQQGTSDCGGLLEKEEQLPCHPLRALTSGLLDSQRKGKTAWVEKLVERVVDERLRQLLPRTSAEDATSSRRTAEKTPSFATSSFGMSSDSNDGSGFPSLKSLLAVRALGAEPEAAPARQCDTAITRLEHQVEFLERELAALQDSFFTCTDACNMLRQRMGEVDVVLSDWAWLITKLQEVQDELRDLKMESTLSKFHFKAKHQEVQDELRSLRLQGTPRSDGSERPCVDWDQVDKTMMVTAVKANRSESPRVECVRVDSERIEAELKALSWDQCKCHANFPEGEEHKQPRSSPRACNSEEPTSSDSTITLFSCTTICVTTPME